MIFAIPGMGADRRAFPGAWTELEDVKFVEWTRYLSFGSIAELAVRIAEGEGIRDGDSIVGFSLGGMVGSEIAKHRRIDRLVLVASATDRTEVSALLAALRPLAPIAPVPLVKVLSSSVPGDLARMIEDADVGFVRSMCGAIFEWEGLGGAHSKPVRIHGRRDLVIPPPSRADLLLEGGHMIAMTHAEDCVSYLERIAPEVFRR